MSDYIPNPPNPDRDTRDPVRFYEEKESGKGMTLVVGILVAIAVAAGVMFFAGTPNDGRNNQAQLPAQERTMTPLVEQTPPALPATPAAPRQ